MNIRRHKDGTYTLGGLSRADIENLAFGALCAEVFYGKPPAYDGVDPEHSYRRRMAFSRLANELKALAELRAATGLSLTSDDWQGDDSIYQRAAR
jgi:hypothetical protein